MAKTPHVTKEQLERLVTTTSLSGERIKVVRHLLSGCAQCGELARAILLPGEGGELDYSGVMRRIGLGYVVAKGMIEEEKIHAERSWWSFLGRLDSGSRLRAIRDNPKFQTWGLLDLALSKAKDAVREKPIEAIDLAHTGLFIASLLDKEHYGEERVNDFKATAYSVLGNVKRLLGDFQGAEEALRNGERLLEEGTGDPYEEAQMIAIRASLLTDLGYLEEAADLLHEGIILARIVGDRYYEGRLTIKQSSSIGWVDPQHGLELAYQGLSLIMNSTTRDEHLELGGRHLAALWNNELGHTEEARETLETYRHVYAEYEDPSTVGRLLFLDGRISRNEGRYEESERLFRQLVEHYSSHSMEFDLALAGMEWAESLVLLGRFDEGYRVMSDLYPLIEAWNIHVDVLRSWLIVRDAVRGKAIRQHQFQELAITIRRKWYRKGNGASNS
jgi:tetratricopeptide (TPR) repeat protein